MDVARHRHAVHFDLDDVLIRSDMLRQLAVNITGNQVGWCVRPYEQLAMHLKEVARHDALPLGSR
jgi:hypothetical protein